MIKVIDWFDSIIIIRVIYFENGFNKAEESA
jgi:hypothetical protein